MSKFPDVTPNPPILQGKFGAAAFKGTQYEELLNLTYKPNALDRYKISMITEWNDKCVTIFARLPLTNMIVFSHVMGLEVISEKYVEVYYGGVLLYDSTLIAI